MSVIKPDCMEVNANINVARIITPSMPDKMAGSSINCKWKIVDYQTLPLFPLSQRGHVNKAAEDPAALCGHLLPELLQ